MLRDSSSLLSSVSVITLIIYMRCIWKGLSEKEESNIEISHVDNDLFDEADNTVDKYI
jgi:hypothetical protein